MPNPGPRYLIDWDADESVAEADLMTSMLAALEASMLEDVTPDVRVNPPTVVRRGRDQARELAPFMVGSSEFRLRNDDGRYSSQNAASPLYGLLLPGRKITIDVGYGGARYPIATTYTEEPEERPLLQDRYVQILGLDGFSRMDTDIYTDMHVSVRSDVALGRALDAVGWPASKRVLDTGKTTFARWWASGQKPADVFRQIVLSEGLGANLYMDAEDNVVFESRHYRYLTSRCTTPQATFRDQGTEPLMRGFGFKPGKTAVVNECAIQVRSYALSAEQTIWTGPTPLVLAPGQTWRRLISTDADAFDDAVDPTAGGGDFTVASGSVASASLDRDGGKIAELTIVASAAGATLTGLRVRGKTVTVSTVVVGHTVDTSASRGKYGPKGLPPAFQPLWVPTTAEAEDWCNAVVGRYATEVPQGVFVVNNATEDRLLQALERRLSDRVHLTDTGVSAFDADVMLESVEYRFDPHGEVFEASFFWERARDQTAWVLGVAGLSELDVTTRAAY